MNLAALVWYGARICLVVMFPFSAIDKIWHWDNALAQTRSGQMPGAKTALVAKAMLVAAIIIEGVTPVLIVAGLFDRVAAFVLAGFCVVTAFLYHPFWTYDDFWIAADTSKAREHFWQFLKNFGFAGGLGLVIFTGTMTPPRAVVDHSLRSPQSP